MLQKEICRELLKDKKFNELYKYFENEYKVILDDLLELDGIDSSNLSLAKTLIISSSNYSEISDLLILIGEICFDIKKGVYERLDNLIELYKPLKEFYNKKAIK